MHQDCSISPGSFSRLRQSVGISDKLNLQPVHRWQICSASAQLWVPIKLSNLAIFCNIWMQRLSWGSVISTPPVYQKRRHLSLGLRCRFSKCIFMSRCCKDKKTFSKTNKVFIFLHHQTTKQKTSQARYNLTRFADFNVPRHPVFPCHPFTTNDNAKLTHSATNAK